MEEAGTPENYNKRTLMDYRPDIKVLGCTMWDGDLKIISDFRKNLSGMAQRSVDAIYLVGSFGSFYPEQITKLSQKYVGVAGGLHEADAGIDGSGVILSGGKI